jgi:thiamin-phosphate kinase
MKEKELINIIKSVLNSEYIGDDCAYLKDLGIVVSQDSLVEDVHFSLSYTTAYQLGWKSVMVNISDICASGAEPKYLTIALSIPDYIDEKFVEEFYKGAKEACGDVKIVGGDITGADKLYISVTAIGSTGGRKISSRKNAKIGYKVIVSGEHGNSAKGLEILSEGWMSGCIEVWRLSEDRKAGRQEGKLFTCHCEENAEHSTWQSRNLKKLDCFANARNDVHYFTLAVSSFVVSCKRPVLTGRGNESEA